MTNEQVVIFHDIMKLFAKHSGESLSSILKSSIQVTTPQIQEQKTNEVGFALLQPVIFVKFCLTDRASGNIVMIFRQRDMQVFLNELMGNEDLPEPDFEFDDVALSAAGEIMNQMIKKAAASIAGYLVGGDGMKTSACQLMLYDEGQKLDKIIGCDGEDMVQMITYKLVINDMIESEFIQCISEEAFESIEEAVEKKRAADEERMESERKADLQNLQKVLSPSGSGEVPVLNGRMAPEPVTKGDAGYGAYNAAGSAGYAAAAPEPAIKGNLGLIMNVPLNVCVEIGKTKRKLRDVLNFNNGTVIELEKAADAPVDIIVNGQLIARGEVVVIDDNFGVKVSEIIDTKNIIRNGGLS